MQQIIVINWTATKQKLQTRTLFEVLTRGRGGYLAIIQIGCYKVDTKGRKYDAKI